MAKGLVKDSTLTAIANAIREKTETTVTMLPSEMAALIQGISGAKVTYGEVTYSVYGGTSTKTITHNLGEIPNLFIMFYAPLGSGTAGYHLYNVLMPDQSTWVAGSSSGSNLGVYTSKNTYSNPEYTDITESTITVKAKYSTFSGRYIWVAGVVE